MNYLVDTNVLSEARKGPRADAGVRAWLSEVDDLQLFTSVLVLGEIRRGVELKRGHDPLQAGQLDQWLRELIVTFEDRILPVDIRVTEAWGRLNVPDLLPAMDGLIAATALVYGATVVTRNVRDMSLTGAQVFNPFQS